MQSSVQATFEDLGQVYISSLFFQYQEEILELILRQIPRRLLNLSKAIFCWCIASLRSVTKYELIEILVLKDDPTAPPVDVGNPRILQKCEDKIASASGGLVTFGT